MPDREQNFQLLLDLSRELVLQNGCPRAVAAAERVFGRLCQSEGRTGGVAAGRLPVCPHAIDSVCAGMAAAPSPLPELASAFQAVEGRLAWSRRKTAEPSDQPFYDGHANTTLIGPDGLEQRDDVWVGATVMAPGVLYPDHSHPPEEFYLSFGEGEWWNAGTDWTRPGPGGIIYNPPGILHAMRSGATPLLALWFLPIG